MKQLAGRLMRFLGSRKFFYGILVFLAIESAWVACSAVYPMAFDEDFHLGIIKIYSHHWLPFLSGQPANSSQFGALQHDPSYLYQYLMSFPYRLLTHITHSQTAQIIALRFINIALFAWGVWLFQKVLRRAGVSTALTNLTLALFVLIPIVPLLAGQINYDNLMLPLVAWLCLLVFAVYENLRRREVPLRQMAILAVVCLLGSLVKYPFLPLAAVAVLFLAIVAGRSFEWRVRRAWLALRDNYRTLHGRVKVLLLLLVVLSASLFLQRYGENMVRYHNPVPSCDMVLSDEDCMAYGPWARNYVFAQTKTGVNDNPVAYTWQWLQSLHYRLFFTVDGPADSFRNYPPLPLPAAAAVVVVVCGTIAAIFYWRPLFRGRPLLLFLLGLGVLYCMLLWAEDYSQFVETGQPVAINGRYLLPVALPLAVVLGRALALAFRRSLQLKTAAAAAVLLLFLQGGGALSFILRSDAVWDWPSAGVVHANNAVRKVLAPVVIEGDKYY